MINRRWFINYDLENVKIFVTRALSVDDEYDRMVSGESQLEENGVGVEFQDNTSDEEMFDQSFGKYERANDRLLAYYAIVARAALNEINLIVEYELKVLATFIVQKNSGNSWADSWVKRRGDASRIIENTYKIKLKNLPGFGEVEKVRCIINAYKHDAGYAENEYEPFDSIWDLKAEIRKKYELNADEVMKSIDAAKVFLNSIPGDHPELGAEISRLMKITSNIGSKK